MTSTQTLATADEVQDYLAALPTTPDEVAALFVDLGIRGQREECGDCPIAGYLREIAGDYQVSVADSHVHLYHEGEEIEVEMPEHLGAFVNAFDIGCYPEVEA